MLYEFFEKIYALEKSGKEIVKLNVGEPDWHPPKNVIRAAYTAMKEHKDKYGSSAGELELREKIAAMHGCTAKNVVITPGSKIGIYALMKLALSNSDNAILFSPHWTAYELMCKSIGTHSKIVNLKSSEKWKMDFEKLESNIDQSTKMIILNSPCNPTSNAWSENEEKEIIEIAKRKGIAVLADDAYRNLCFDGRKERQFDGSTLIAGTFSKTFGMTGWRLGYVVAPEEIAKKVVSFNQITVTNVPVFIQLAGIKALEEKEKTANKARRMCKRRARIAEQMLKGKMGFVKPNAGFYMFPELPEGKDALQFVDKLLDKGVAVTPGAAFGDYRQHVRISLCREDDVLKNALEKIRELL